MRIGSGSIIPPETVRQVERVYAELEKLRKLAENYRSVLAELEKRGIVDKNEDGTYQLNIP